jgi:hypothetical protein
MHCYTFSWSTILLLGNPDCKTRAHNARSAPASQTAEALGITGAYLRAIIASTCVPHKRLWVKMAELVGPVNGVNNVTLDQLRRYRYAVLQLSEALTLVQLEIMKG